MTLVFFLLGSFEIQVGTAIRRPLGNTQAAKILAFLALMGRFCPNNEIVTGCWGPDRVAGKNKLDDDAYRKQISLLRSLLAGLGLRPDDYLSVEPNGLELREDTFDTDVRQFDELSEIGMNRDLSVDQRATALQAADDLRRGYLLDGMHAHFIEADETGARREYGMRFQRVRAEIRRLQRTGELDGPESAPRLLPYFDGFYDVLQRLRQAIAEAKNEVVISGISLSVAIPAIDDVLLDRLREGLSVKIILLDPNGRWLPHMASLTGNDQTTQQQEGALTLRRLRALGERAATGGSSTLGVGTIDAAISGLIYAIDPGTDAGQFLYFPCLDGTTPSRLPGYLWSARSTGPYAAHLNELRARMHMASTQPIGHPIEPSTA